jgi:hypothetical protein
MCNVRQALLESQRGLVIVEETIEGKHYIFNSTRCASIFKKLVNVMGEETSLLMV